jgi:hypothetical protein
LRRLPPRQEGRWIVADLNRTMKIRVPPVAATPKRDGRNAGPFRRLDVVGRISDHHRGLGWAFTRVIAACTTSGSGFDSSCIVFCRMRRKQVIEASLWSSARISEAPAEVAHDQIDVVVAQVLEEQSSRRPVGARSGRRALKSSFFLWPMATPTDEESSDMGDDGQAVCRRPMPINGRTVRVST